MQVSSPIALWVEWFRCVQLLRPACSRKATFKWLSIALVGFTVRGDIAGVTSFVRALGLKEAAYYSLLDFFHTPALNLTKLTHLWARLALKLFAPVQVGGRTVFLADGIKVAKEGRHMPAVKKLHQESNNNTKPEFIWGHSLQAVSLLAQNRNGSTVAVPLVSRIHEGVVRSNRDKRTLLDRLVLMFCDVVTATATPAVLVADAYYCSRKVMQPLLAAGHHVVTRARTNAVAYRPAPPSTTPRRGRRAIYGERVELRSIFDDWSSATSAPSPVYGEDGVTLSYRVVDLLWRPIGRLVRVVLVSHPKRGRIMLMSTDTEMDPLAVIALYGYRFKIEVGFKQALRTLGAYAYRFWMATMKPLSRKRSGNTHIHMESEDYREQVLRKIAAYHRYVQVACIAQGLQQHLATNFHATVWSCFRSWLRTMAPSAPPSEAVVASTMRTALDDLRLDGPEDLALTQFLRDQTDPSRCPGFVLAA